MTCLYRLAVVAPVVALLVATSTPAGAQKGKKKSEKATPKDALAQVQVAKGLKVEVWAAEPLMENPVSFAFDEKGRVFVAETNRFHTGVPDTRDHMYWLDEDLANRSINDLVAMYKKHKFGPWDKYHDQLRLVWDSNNDGKADKSEIFSGGYNRPQDGLAAGVLARKGNVYFTCIPDLYLLKDTDGDNKADLKKSLFTGFGPTAQFLGHDLHGLRMGPDGKLYFSVGDRGFNVTTKEGKKLQYPNTGAVLRCDPDGSNLEVVHYGLRNPQELAFDDFGNLFTYDNNSDSGDRARWVYIVEGGDSGWRGGYQYGTSYHLPGTPQGNRGPWNSEQIWHVPDADSTPPAYVVPPLANFGNGPAGITHYPGVGLNEKYKDHFFACDFTSNPGSSVIWSLSVKPKGAGFEVVKPEAFVRGMVPTDCDFGPDGAFYWSDWVGGWSPPGKGRIFRLTDPEAMKDPAVAEAKKLLAEGMEKKSVEELAKLLEHPHQQVRLEAQWELAKIANGRSEADAAVAIEELARVAKDSKNRLARLHAIWGLGMISQWNDVWARMITLADDSDPEIRAQVIRVLGDRRSSSEDRLFAKWMSDPEPRVKHFAAIALGKSQKILRGDLAGFAPLFDLLKSNNDADPYLRHAAVIGLTEGAHNHTNFWNVWLQAKEKYDTPAVRLGALLVLRRYESERCAEFLADADPRIVAEAARAIHDERIEGALAKLAEVAEKPGQPDAVAYRALSANFKLGTAEAAERVARFAARTTEAAHARVFALKLLADWSNPPRRDHITGLTADLPKPDAKIAADALKPVIGGAFSGSDAVRAEAAKTSAKLGIKEVGPLLAAIVRDAKAPATDRADALAALAAVKDTKLAEVAKFAATSPEPKLRAAALAARANLEPDAVLKELPALLKDAKASIAEKQAAFAVLGQFKESADADRIVHEWLTAAADGKAPPELLLDITEAAQLRTKPLVATMRREMQRGLEKFEAGKTSTDDKLAAWKESLAGGDADRGRSIFLSNAAVYCQRCHKLDGQGGEVGPDLNGIASQMGKDRRYFLESLVMPSAQIAKGYETAVLNLIDGRVVSGVVRENTKKQIKLLTAEAKELVIPADDIESRRTGPSAMPDDLHKKLSRRELRDVVEFLVSLKGEKKEERR